jgi:S1-C subfamily serine protease
MVRSRDGFGQEDEMATKRRLVGVGLILSFAAGVAVSSLASSQLVRRTEPASRTVAPRGELTVGERSLTELFEEATPSVVYITSVSLRRDFFRMNVMEIPSGTGSGFVWDNRGNIVTNFHVIRGADRAEVTLADGSTWPASLVGYAQEKDLAVLQIEAPRDRLRPIPVGTSNDLKVGQNVLAIGNPFGYDQTLTTGIVSALGREIESTDGIPIRDVIQTDAAINPGNSGGPLLDSAGRLIGVNTAIVSPSGGYAGVGFAIPVDTVNWVVPQLIAYGKVKRPSLGVELASDHIVRRSRIVGAVVIGVDKGSSADKAGIRPAYRDRRGRVMVGDVIVALNGKEVRSGGELGLLLERHRENETVTVTIERDGKKRDVALKLGASR